MVLAYTFINKARASSTHNKKRYWYIATAWIASALLTYPAMAFFYCSMVLMKVLFSPLANWIKTRREIVQEIGLFLIICLIYFIWAHFNSNPARLPEKYHLSPNLNISEMKIRLLPLANFFGDNPWRLPLSDSVRHGGILLILLTGGVIYSLIGLRNNAFFIQNKDQAITALTQSILSTAVLFILCSGFYLIIPGREDMGSRLLFATAASGLPLLFWSIYQWCNLFPAFLRKNITLFAVLTYFLIVGYKANMVTTIDALNYAEYINTVKDKLAERLADNHHKLRHIHFIIPGGGYPGNKFLLINTVLARMPGHKEVKAKWCPEEQTTAECLATLPTDTIAVTYSRPDAPYLKTQDMMLLDDQYRVLWVLFGYA